MQLVFGLRKRHEIHIFARTAKSKCWEMQFCPPKKKHEIKMTKKFSCSKSICICSFIEHFDFLVKAPSEAPLAMETKIVYRDVPYSWEDWLHTWSHLP